MEALVSRSATKLPEILNKLELRYGPRRDLSPKLPFDLAIWEIVAYLQPDDRRLRAFNALKQQTGLEPERILETPIERLTEITRIGGIFPELRADRLHIAAELVINEFGGDLSRVLKLPFAKARQELSKFPMIGKPGAEKILLYTKTYPVLALESNAVRTLQRIGYGTQTKASYSVLYRSVQTAVEGELPKECDPMIRAHILLRVHGQETCRRNAPMCNVCPVQSACAYFFKLG